MVKPHYLRLKYTINNKQLVYLYNRAKTSILPRYNNVYIRKKTLLVNYNLKITVLKFMMAPYPFIYVIKSIS